MDRKKNVSLQESSYSDTESQSEQESDSGYNATHTENDPSSWNLDHAIEDENYELSINEPHVDDLKNINKSNVESNSDLSSEYSSDSDKEPEVNNEYCNDSDAIKNDLDELLYEGSHLSKKESALLIMAHILRFHLSEEATSSLLQLIRWHLPVNSNANFPTTKYLFLKYFSSSKSFVEPHYFCKSCKYNYLGPIRNSEENLDCDICHESLNVETLLKDGSYFLVYDLPSQLQNLLELSNPVLSSNDEYFDVSDITHSTKYRKKKLREQDISVTWNTDGVPIFQSSKFNIWPLQLTVNELPLKARARNTLIAGLWFGYNKPNMNCYLKPFVESMNALSSQGITWETKDKKKIHSRVYPGPCAVDSIARCIMLNMTQFNGEYGCPWCLHPGIYVSNTRVYPFKDHSNVLKRSHISVVNDAKEAVRTSYFTNGIKGPSVLLRLNYFDIVEDVMVDYMHCLCLGVFRNTTNLWLDTKNHTKDFYIGTKIKDLDLTLLAIKVPKEFSRKPRSFDTRAYWKASEWRNWALFYSPVVLKGILPRKFYKNWMKLIAINHALLAKTIQTDCLFEVREIVSQFLAEYEKLYGSEYMSFNVHQILHLVDCVSNCGPLWCYSAFPFESNNGRLLKLFSGTQFIQLQISPKFLFLQFLPTLVIENDAFKKSLCLKHFSTL